MEFLKRIQSKSNDTKAHYALVTAFLVTILIALIWVTTLSARFSVVGNTSQNGDVPDIENSRGTFSDILEDTKSQVGAITDSFSNTKPAETSNLEALMNTPVTSIEENVASDEVSEAESEPQPTTETIEQDTKEPEEEAIEARTVLIGVQPKKDEGSTTQSPR